MVFDAEAAALIPTSRTEGLIMKLSMFGRLGSTAWTCGRIILVRLTVQASHAGLRQRASATASPWQPQGYPRYNPNIL